ncbi:hypothetical protein AMATHDRAFT_148667 [Amanita thiersii Skay4041]|uniref:Endoplasmic reticulum junction formation protein lunapark n=1 Tax=Amanita thiersii Skay4041 TaxID=703135 RepID=A0A2A9NMS3_9AGAR|nr:hypothetical protein AMATHDRAFT_148667 [Amanita thiersii Skay4041]
MSFLKNLFSKKKDEDYETILSNLAEDIRKRQIQLSEIRLRERRSTLLVTLYTLAAWVAYVTLWYMKLLPDFHPGYRHNGAEKAIKAVPVILGPIVILFIRRIVQIWYQRKGDAEEKMLQELMKKQRGVVEDIKKKTNYYSTQELLQKYDSSPINSPLHQRVVPNPLQPATPQLLQKSPAVIKSPSQSATLQSHLTVTPPPFPSVPPRKQWYDKLADALLGDDEHAPGASTSRYALICENCFAHNGLVKESMWEDSQYVCPKCKHFNSSARSKRERHAPRTPPQSDRHSPSPEPPQRRASTSPSSSSQSVSAPDVPRQRKGEANLMDVDGS